MWSPGKHQRAHQHEAGDHEGRPYMTRNDGGHEAGDHEGRPYKHTVERVLKYVPNGTCWYMMVQDRPMTLFEFSNFVVQSRLRVCVEVPNLTHGLTKNDAWIGLIRCMVFPDLPHGFWRPSWVFG